MTEEALLYIKFHNWPEWFKTLNRETLHPFLREHNARFVEDTHQYIIVFASKQDRTLFLLKHA